MTSEGQTLTRRAWPVDGRTSDPVRRIAIARFVRRAGLVWALLTALVLAMSAAAPERAERTLPRAATAGLQTLPLAARSLVSRTLGHDQAAYRIHRAARGLAAANSAHGLELRFGAGGVQVRAGGETLSLRLRAAGYGQELEPVPAALPKEQANQVSYRRGSLSEWYANGPLGLEQGFSLQAPPAGARTGPLTLALSLSGNLRPSLERGRRSLSFGGSGSGLRYSGLAAFDADGHSRHAWLELREQTLLVRVADGNARYPLTIDPFIRSANVTAGDGAAQVKLSASDGTPIGDSIAISGDTIVVGALRATVSGRPAQGAAYVFVRPATGWVNATQTAKLTVFNGNQGDQLGASVAISGDTIVAGAPGRDTVAHSDEGAAYVFVKPAGGWADATGPVKLSASDASTGAALGRSVAVEGDTIVAGNQGAAYVFVKPAGGWVKGTETARLAPSAGPDNPGFPVAISSDAVVAGAPYTVDASRQVYQGAAYVFVKPPDGWIDATETAKLSASDASTTSHDLLGGSIAISSDTILAGAPDADISQDSDGAVYVFVKPAGGWTDTTETAKLTSSDGAVGDALGSSVAISGDSVIAGAPFANVAGRSNQGAVYVFVKPAGGWTDATQSSKLVAADGAAGDDLGTSVAISGGTPVAGGAYFYPGPGAVSAYVFLAPTITLTKALVPASDSGRFDLEVGETVVKASAADGDSGSSQVAAGPYTIREAASIGNLSNYAKSIVCTKNGLPDVSGAGASLQVTVATGDDERCTITNTRKATITETKSLVPATDSGRFDLKVGATVVKAGAGEGDSGSIRVAPGTYDVSEAATVETSLSDYTTSIACTLNGGTGPTGTGPALQVTVAPLDVLACTLVNKRKVTVTLAKHLVPAADSGRFDLKVAGAVIKASAGDGGSGSIQVLPGTYRVAESAAAGTSLDNYATSIACTRNGNPGPSANGSPQLTGPLAAGDQLVCTFTNQRKAKVTLTKHLVPASDPGRFDLKLSSGTLVRVVKTSAGDGDSGSIQVAPRTWTVLESAASGTSLSDYSSSIACTRNGNPGPSGNGTSLPVTLAASDMLACTFTNQRK